MCEETLEDSTSLKTLYDKVRPQIRVLKDGVTFLDMDRDEKKMDVFLTFHRSSLLVSDMKIFLPFTINLDPYIKKKIKEEHHSTEQDVNQGPVIKNLWNGANDTCNYGNKSSDSNFQGKLFMKNHSQVYSNLSQLSGSIPPLSFPVAPWSIPSTQEWISQTPWINNGEPVKSILVAPNLPAEIIELKLSNLNVNNVCDLLSKIEEIDTNRIATYKNIVRDNNIHGKVLFHCELSDLKQVTFTLFICYFIFSFLICALFCKHIFFQLS